MATLRKVRRKGHVQALDFTPDVTPVPVPTPTPTPVPVPTPTPTPAPVPTLGVTDGWTYHGQPTSSIVAPGSGVVLKVRPLNGNWPAVLGGTLVCSTKALKYDGTTVTGGSAGTFGSVPAIPAGTANELSITYTSVVAGLHLVTISNTLGMTDWGYIPIASFAIAAGTGGVTISQTVVQAATVRNGSNWEKDVWIGSPGGGWTGLTRGWARMDIGLTLSGTTGGMQLRVFDARSAGAIPGTVGSGTMLHGAVQVSGALPSGAQTLRICVPAFGNVKLYLELSADNGTTWFRIPKRVLIGHRVIYSTRSELAGLAIFWAITYSSSTPDFLTMAGGWDLATSFAGIDNNLYGSADWIEMDGSRPGGVPAPQTSPGFMEMSRLMSGAIGDPISIIGAANLGGSISNHFSETGHLNTLAMLPFATNGLTKARFALFDEKDDQYSDDQYSREYTTLMDWLRTTALGAPTLAAFQLGGGYRSGKTTILGGGYGRMDAIIQKLEATRKDIVCPMSEWGGFFSSHATLESRVIYARDAARALLSRTDPAFGGFPGNTYGSPMGPTLTTGYRLPGSPILRIPILHRGGTALQTHKITESQTAVTGAPSVSHTTFSTPGPMELGSTVLVRLPGEEWGYGRKATRKNFVFEPVYGVAVDTDHTVPIEVHNEVNEIWIRLNMVQVNGVNSILFKDTTTTPLLDSQGFTLLSQMDSYGLNMYTPGNTTTFNTPDINGVSHYISDDNNSLGLPYGHTMARTFSCYIAAPAPAPFTAGLNQPPTQIAGGWMEVRSGPGTGPPMTGLKLSLDGGTPTEPLWVAKRDDNSWDARLIVPTGVGSHTIGFHPNGQVSPLVTRTFPVVASPVSFQTTGPDVEYMGLSSGARTSFVESWTARNRKAQWKDAAGTQNVTAQYDTIAAWDGDSTDGVTNRLTQFTTIPLPAIDLSSLCASGHVFGSISVATYDIKNRHVGVLFERQVLSGTCSAMSAQVNGDLTVIAAHRSQAGNSIFPPWKLLNVAHNGIFGIFGPSTWFRGTKTWTVGPPVDASFLGSGMATVNLYIMRYRASDGQLDVFSLAADGRGVPFLASQTWGAESITVGGMYMCPCFGEMFSLQLFSTFFGGDLNSGDVAAAATYLANRYKDVPA